MLLLAINQPIASAENPKLNIAMARSYYGAVE